MTAEKLLLTGYCAALGITASVVVGDLFLSLGLAEALELFGILGGLGLALGITVHALWPPRWASLWRAGLALAAGAVLWLTIWDLRGAGRRLFVQVRQPALVELATDIVAYGRVRSMNDGLTYWKTLNGVDVAYTEAERDAILPGQGRRPRLERVLERDSITPAKYREYRERLQDLHFHAFVASESHVLFVRTRSSGVLYALPGRQTTTREGDVGFGNMHLKSLTALANGWYYAVW